MKKRQKICLSLVAIFLVLVVSATAFMIVTNNHLKKAIKSGYTPISKHYTGETHSSDSESFLIMGLDNTIERKLGTTRTDAMMVVTVNYRTKEITFCSLPRDSFVDIVSDDYDGMQRIEAAYTYGGPSASVNTVEKFLNIPIDHYVVFNFLSFIQLIDAVGGIDITVQNAFDGVTKDGPGAIHFDEGKQHLDGTKALSYARERHSDNDIMRGFRQQEIIQSVKNKLTDTTSIASINRLIDSLDNNIQTNIADDQIDGLIARLLKTTKFTQKRLTFDWRSFSNEGRSMVELYPDSVAHVSHKLRMSLGLERPDDTDKNNGAFHTDGRYLYQSDYSVQDKEQEDLESTAANGSTYVGTPGNTKTGKLPTRKTENGFIS